MTNFSFTKPSDMDSCIHIVFIIWNKTFCTTGQYLMGSTGIQSGPADLWFVILPIVSLNSFLVSPEEGDRNAGMLGLDLVSFLTVSAKLPPRKCRQMLTASVADSIILPDAYIQCK